MAKFQIDQTTYRIYRIDSANLAIQRYQVFLNTARWQTLSYHGNSPKSLVRGILELITKHHEPDNFDDIVGALNDLSETIDYNTEKILEKL